MRSILTITLVLAFISSPIQAQETPPKFNLHLLDAGTNYGRPSGVNDDGTVVGFVSPKDKWAPKAAVWRLGNDLSLLPTAPGYEDFQQGYQINNLGQVTVAARRDGLMQTLIYENGEFVEPEVRSTRNHLPEDLTEAGLLWGISSQSQTKPLSYVFDPNTQETTYLDEVDVIVTATNEAGLLVGRTKNKSPPRLTINDSVNWNVVSPEGCTTTPRFVTEAGKIFGTTNCFPSSVYSSGRSRVFEWNQGQFTDVIDSIVDIDSDRRIAGVPWVDEGNGLAQSFLEGYSVFFLTHASDSGSLLMSSNYAGSLIWSSDFGLWSMYDLLPDLMKEWDGGGQFWRISRNGKFVAGWLQKKGSPYLQGFLLELVTEVDSDSDGILDDSDNCPSIPNPDQADLDGDNIGDACDTDVDGDSVEDALDNCPLVANSDQLDVDGDLIGDACDDLIDNDADGIANDLDNCPAVPNADQADNDRDLQGDACDLDDDNDGVEDTVDNCSLTANEDQADNDSDNIGDVCDSDDDNDAIEDDLDNCPLIANVSQDDNDGDGFGDVCDPDDDNDAVNDSVDNCPLSFNPDQSNTDGVGAGDACNDAFDVDDDDWENDYDNCPDIANRNQSDFDYDNIGDACDSDVDGDEVANAADACELTPLGELVGSIGCSIEQLCPCDAPRQSTDPWKNHGQYVSCMTKAAQSFAADGVISDNEKSDLVNAAAQSSCGY